MVHNLTIGELEYWFFWSGLHLLWWMRMEGLFFSWFNMGFVCRFLLLTSMNVTESHEGEKCSCWKAEECWSCTEKIWWRIETVCHGECDSRGNPPVTWGWSSAIDTNSGPNWRREAGEGRAGCSVWSIYWWDGIKIAGVPGFCSKIAYAFYTLPYIFIMGIIILFFHHLG